VVRSACQNKGRKVWTN